MVSRLSGLGAWLLQRLSAVYLLLFMVLLVPAWAAAPGEGHAALSATLARPSVALAAALSVLSILMHAWVGMRDVILDYVRPTGLRLAVLAGLASWLLVLGFWSAWLLFGVTAT